MVARCSCANTICKKCLTHPVLSERLHEVGVNGKCWQLMKSWCEGATCQVKVDDGTCHTQYRKVSSKDQFFLLLFSCLSWRVLEQSGLGLSVNNFYTGGFLHANDIRTLAR